MHILHRSELYLYFTVYIGNCELYLVEYLTLLSYLYVGGMQHYIENSVQSPKTIRDINLWPCAAVDRASVKLSAAQTLISSNHCAPFAIQKHFFYKFRQKELWIFSNLRLYSARKNLIVYASVDELFNRFWCSGSLNLFLIRKFIIEFKVSDILFNCYIIHIKYILRYNHSIFNIVYLQFIMTYKVFNVKGTHHGPFPE